MRIAAPRSEMSLQAVAAAVMAVAACSGPRPAMIDLAAVNAAVPEEMRSTLAFEQRDLVVEVEGVKARYSIAVPAGFKIMPWRKPSASNQVIELGDLDQGKLTLGSLCDGACGLRDWKATVDELSFVPIRAIQATEVAADETTTDPATRLERRVLIAKHAGVVPRTTVVHATWMEGGDRYWICQFELTGAFQSAVAAFVKACATMQRSDDRATPIVSNAKPPPNFIDIPNHPEIEIHVQPDMKPFALSPAIGGFESVDGVLFIVERAEDGLVDVATFKDQTRAAEWLTERPSKDGWIVTYIADLMTPPAPDHGVQVRRKIGNVVYKCGGIVTQQQLEIVIAACTSIQPKAR